MNFWEYKKILYISLILFLNAVLFYFLNRANIDLFIASKYISGWDGSTHYSMALLYSQNIFPAVWGWVPNYFFGMPFPQFYPPLFSYVFSLIHIFINNPTLIYKSILLLCVFIQPILFFFFYYKLSKKLYESGVVLFLTTLLLSISDPMNSITNSFFGAINIGVVSQIITSLFFYLFVYFLSKANTVFNICMRTLLLVFIFLGSVHLSMLAFILFVLSFLYDFFILKEKKSLGIYFLNGIISLGIAGFWVIPMFYYYDFSTALPLNPELFNLGFYWDNKWIFLIPLFATFHSIFKLKNKFIFVVSSSTLFVFIAEKFPNALIFQYVPMHLDRYVAMLFQFIPLLFVYLVSVYVFERKQKIVVHIAAVLFLFLNILFSSNPIFLRGVVQPDFNGFFDTIISSVDNLPKQSRILMEYYTFIDTPMSRVANDYAGAVTNSQMIITIFRESSISSIFNVPVRNLFSENEEHWGVRSKLALDEVYLNKDFYKKAIDTKMLGVQYVYVKSNKILNKLKKDTSFEFIEKNGAMNVFEVKYKDKFDTPNYTVLEYKPILIVSEIDTKHFNENRLDFIGLSEQLLSLSENKIHFAYTNISELQNISFDDFSFVLLDKKILEENKDMLFKYSVENPSIKFFIPDSVDGFEKNNNVLTYVDMTNYYFNQAYFRYMFDSFKKYLVKVEQPKNLFYEHIDNSFIFSNKDKTPAYILIKNSYYPSWVSTSGQRVYHASPNFMFVKLGPDSSNVVYFSTPRVVVLAHYISLITLFILGMSVVLIWFKGSKNN